MATIPAVAFTAAVLTGCSAVEPPYTWSCTVSSRSYPLFWCLPRLACAYVRAATACAFCASGCGYCTGPSSRGTTPYRYSSIGSSLIPASVPAALRITSAVPRYFVVAPMSTRAWAAPLSSTATRGGLRELADVPVVVVVT